ncbi:Hypothetical_protein [Hexamita inflata]|uniref:Hypothetical_protein n=1 Tax=Hexamita inflata TaxID=28002 RepID=A0AA86PEH1_9EUKA|nr:Hypothetical protein HINF_LOCUS24702 [Hexamita inflata]
MHLTPSRTISTSQTISQPHRPFPKQSASASNVLQLNKTVQNRSYTEQYHQAQQIQIINKKNTITIYQKEEKIDVEFKKELLKRKITTQINELKYLVLKMRNYEQISANQLERVFEAQNGVKSLKIKVKNSNVSK